MEDIWTKIDNDSGGGTMVIGGTRKYSLIIFYILLITALYLAVDESKWDNNVKPDTGKPSTSPELESEYDIMIDLTESMLYLFKGNQLIKKYPVAQGKDDSPSPIGIWEITTKARNWGTGFGTRWMGINVPWGIYGIHGTNKPYSVGQRASGGCFRMHNSDVEELYAAVPYKTKVYVYGGPLNNLGSYLDVLEPGDRQSHVLEVQLRLRTKGYYQGEIDGIYGEGMKQALLSFKKDAGLSYNHFVDEETYRALGILDFE